MIICQQRAFFLCRLEIFPKLFFELILECCISASSTLFVKSCMQNLSSIMISLLDNDFYL
jgi:hypothetical protein